MRTCVRCDKTKDVCEFYQCEHYKDGYDYYCIICRQATTDASLKRRARRGPPCSNCNTKHVYYAKGMCKVCYTYKMRTGRDRPTDTDRIKAVVDWAFRTINGDSLEDLADSSTSSVGTIRNVLVGKPTVGRQWRLAYDILPHGMQKKIRYLLTPGRLRPRDVREIRELAANGYTQQEIGVMYNRTYSAISRIVNGSRYADVT